jgi:hypothetical protein
MIQPHLLKLGIRKIAPSVSVVATAILMTPFVSMTLLEIAADSSTEFHGWNLVQLI